MYVRKTTTINNHQNLLLYSLANALLTTLFIEIGIVSILKL